MYTSTLSLTSVLDGVDGQRQTPATLPQGKTRYPLCGRLGGPQRPFGRVRKTSSPTGFDPQTVQSVVSHYTDYATPARPRVVCGHNIEIKNVSLPRDEEWSNWDSNSVFGYK